MENPLSNKTALVTGATRGIGWAIAARLSADGATVTGTGTRPDAKVPAKCRYRQVDFSDQSATSDFAEDMAEAAIDILVNNAGINKISPFAEIDPEDFARIHQVNVTAPFLLCRAVIPYMRRQGWGRIVNIGSIMSKISSAKRGSYSASKFAVDGLTAALAAEVAADGILVNCVSPGLVDTDLSRKNLGHAGFADFVSEIPARRPCRPEEVAACVAWLVGPENTYISGQNICIDGGFTRV